MRISKTDMDVLHNSVTKMINVSSVENLKKIKICINILILFIICQVLKSVKTFTKQMKLRKIFQRSVNYSDDLKKILSIICQVLKSVKNLQNK